MKIARIEVKNFKSFDNQILEIKDLTILIGPNASGKSNTISLIRFLSNIINYGIDDAISLMGGIEYLKNASSGEKDNIYLKYELDFSDNNFNFSIKSRSNSYLTLKRIIVEFEIRSAKRGGNYSLVKNNLIAYYEGFDETSKTTYSNYELVITKTKSNCEIRKKLLIEEENFNKLFIEDNKYLVVLKDFFVSTLCRNKKEVYASKVDFLIPGFFGIDNYIKIYDFDVKKMKKSSSILTAKKLDEEGENIANVLQTILKNREKKRKFLNILRELLPFIREIQVERNYDKSISYLIKEKYSNKKYYSNFLSDGTANIIAIVIALYFGENDEFVVIEEPERNLHPQILGKIVEMAREVSRRKQVVITTHTPELIKNANIEDILFAKRTERGMTKLQHLSDSEFIKEFLKNELGLDDLFVNGFLGV